MTPLIRRILGHRDPVPAARVTVAPGVSRGPFTVLGSIRGAETAPFVSPREAQRISQNCERDGLCERAERLFGTGDDQC